MFYFRHAVPSTVLRLLEHGCARTKCARLEAEGFSPLLIRGVMRSNILITDYSAYYSRNHPPRFHAKYAFGPHGLITLKDEDLEHYWHKNFYGVAGHTFILPHTIRPKSVLVY